MVSFNVYRSTYSGAYVEGICLATDEKPVVGIANGSILFAVDASNGETTRYMYDKESMSWIEAECPCSGGSGGSGSGGSGSGGGLFVDATTGTFDKTWQEIYDAMAEGKNVVVALPANEVPGWETDMGLGSVKSVFRNVGSNTDGAYHVVVDNGNDAICDSANEYPTTDDPGGGGDSE